MRSFVVFPAILKVLMSLILTCIVAILVLLFSPLLEAFAFLYGIGQLPPLVTGMQVSAIVLLFAGVPIAWALGLAGLILEWMTRERTKRKWKQKRQPDARGGEGQLSLQAWVDPELQRDRQAQLRLLAHVKGSAMAEDDEECVTTDTRWRTAGERE